MTLRFIVFKSPYRTNSLSHSLIYVCVYYIYILALRVIFLGVCVNRAGSWKDCCILHRLSKANLWKLYVCLRLQRTYSLALSDRWHSSYRSPIMHAYTFILSVIIQPQCVLFATSEHIVTDLLKAFLDNSRQCSFCRARQHGINFARQSNEHCLARQPLGFDTRLNIA
jgi:cell division protein FtsW (lipid II flippase)